MSRRESRRDDVLVACVAMLAVACGGSKAATAPSPVASTPGPGTPVGIVSASSLCTARPNTMTGPATDPNGPAFHQVVVARTTDGLTLTDATIVQSAASVPDGVRAADGRTLVYYVNGLQHGVSVNRHHPRQVDIDACRDAPAPPPQAQPPKSPKKARFTTDRNAA